uniref:Syntaxin-6-like n=1 Tax=Phallusia mammillata TaxID=59560 RepID=A0A6F9DTA5_9ASCI|nr:syntaxin-6-like [Phallusia mammillata]
MSVEDPFFVVRGEVERSVNACRELQQRWRYMLDDSSALKRDDYDRVSNELRNSLRSIEWDLEDLDETIGIVESNPHKFHISPGELDTRKGFIQNTRNNIQDMKNELNDPAVKAKADKILRKSLLQNGISNHNKNNYDRYSKLKQSMENDNAGFIEDQHQKQQLIIEQQDDQLDLVADSVGILKNMSKTIGGELDDQVIMLDELGHEMENTQNRMDSMLRKMAQVTHMNSDKRQWCAIGVLGSSIFVLFLLFFIP